jgi:uncharacterized protein YjbI with pentapeptide repeats
MLVVIGLVVGVLVFNYYEEQSVLIDELRRADSVDEVAIAEARNDILRHTLTAAAGFAGAAVLLLNFQKQRAEEYNATQQRIADLRIQAVEQLGSDSAAVRIGGLHNLERLGESHAELRQIVLDEIGAYLRLGRETTPSAVHETGPGATADTDDWREVRLVAQEILQRHLKFQTPAQRRRYWNHTQLSLRNAVLVHADLSDTRLVNLDLTGATLHDGADFADALLKGSTSLQYATVNGNLLFPFAIVTGDFSLMGAVVKGRTNFGLSWFAFQADFRAQFAGGANFSRAEFASGADFTAEFGSGANFREAQFAGDVTFSGARFAGDANFNGARFARDALFEGAQFARDALFKGVHANGARFVGAQFASGANFSRAEFASGAHFTAEFAGRALFEGARFRRSANFVAARFARDARFVEAEFGGGGADFDEAQFAGDVTFDEPRVLRDSQQIGPES